MDADKVAVIRDCSEKSLQGVITFPEVVAKLQAIGVERYHADYSRSEMTYYMREGESHVQTLSKKPGDIAGEFSAAGVQAAVKSSQRGEIDYQEFLRRTMASGCVGYFAQISGRQVLYFGRNGDCHVERFPSAA